MSRIPLHEQSAIHVAELLGEIAVDAGPAEAQAFATRTIVEGSLRYPQVVKTLKAAPPEEYDDGVPALGAAAIAGYQLADRVYAKQQTTRAYKAAPDMRTVELPLELADALQAARADEGDAKIAALLRHVAGQTQITGGGTKLTDSGPQSKPVVRKAARVDPWVEAAAGPNGKIATGPATSLADIITTAIDAASREGFR
jgi:hypothetical protein